MKGKVKVWHIVLLSAIIGALLVWLFISMSSKINRLRVSAEEAQQEVVMYSIVVDSLEENVYEASLLIRLKEEEITVTHEQIARLKAENIKYVNVIGSLRMQLSAYKDSLAVKAPADTIVREVEIVSDKPMIELPLYFDYKDKWINMYGEVDIKGDGTLVTVLGDTPINIALGSKAFKRDYVTAISSPNPYLEFDKIDVQLATPSRWKPALLIGGISLGVGLLSGGLLYHQLTK